MEQIVYKTKRPNVLIVDPELELETPNPTFKQKYCVISFVSPEDRIKQRFFQDANTFLQTDVNKQIINYSTYICKDLNTKFMKKMEDIIDTYSTSENEIYKQSSLFLKEIKDNILLNEDKEPEKMYRTYKLDENELIDRFDAYKVVNDVNLKKSFNSKYGNETSVRGLKVSGVYETENEARKSAEFHVKNIEPGVNSMIMPVGYWCPFDPNPDGIKESEYLVNELNELMHNYNDNQKQRKEFHDKRIEQDNNNSLIKKKYEKKLEEVKEKRLKKN